MKPQRRWRVHPVGVGRCASQGWRGRRKSRVSLIGVALLISAPTADTLNRRGIAR